MYKKWFQHDEVMAGSTRLRLTFRLYKIFGEKILKLITFFVVTIAYLTAKERRESSVGYFKTLNAFTKKSFPLYISSFRHFLNYGNSLADKIISFSGNLPYEKFKFADNGEKEISELIKNQKGIFFLTTHIGNIEIMRSFLQSDKYPVPPKINIFLEKKSCEIFNKFLDTVKFNLDKIQTYAVEDIEMGTAIELSQKSECGELIFMAADRISAENPCKTYNTSLLGKKISLPAGALKFAQILNIPVFFIICAKDKNKYNIHAHQFIPKSSDKKEIYEQMKTEYGAFLEKYTLKYPYQFYHFYKFFEE